MTVDRTIRIQACSCPVEGTNRRRASSQLIPVTATVLFRDVWPDDKTTALFGTPSTFARNSTNALLAALSTGGAVNATLSAPLCTPTTLFTEALGATYTRMFT